MYSPYGNYELTDLALERLRLCRMCGEIYGEILTTFRNILHRGPRQRCYCPSESPAELWPHFDFPQAVALCRGCARLPLGSGSRWSPWFCRRCSSAVQGINRLCESPVIPPSRGSFVEQLYAVPTDGSFRSPLPAAVSPDWFDRVEKVEGHCQRRIGENLRQLAARSPDEEVMLVDYLCKFALTREVFRETMLSLGRMFALPESLLLDAIDGVDF